MTRFVAVAILLFAAAARADNKADAEAEMLKAQENLERGEFEAAISRFNVARSLVPSSSGPYLGLGLAYARSNRCEQAIPALEEYLRRKKSNPKPEAAETLADCKKRTAPPPQPEHTPPPPPQPEHTPPPRPPAPRQPPPPLPQPPPPIVPGKLIVEVAPVEARISVNGSQVAESTRRYEGPHTAGEYQVLVEKPGYRSLTTQLQLTAGGSETRALTLQPLKRTLWLRVGVGFTVVALAAGVGAIASYVLANGHPRDTHDYAVDKNATLALQGIFYPTLAVAAVGYLLYGVLNRGRLSDGPPLRVRLTPAGLRAIF